MTLILEQLAEIQDEGQNSSNAWKREEWMRRLDEAIAADLQMRNRACPEGLWVCIGSHQPGPVYKCDSCTFEGCAACFSEHQKEGHSSEEEIRRGMNR